MATLPACVQAFYSTLTGLLVREDGKSRPASLDEIEQDHGQAKLDSIMETPGQWVTLITPATRCRCWAHSRGEYVTVIVPNVGKVVVPIGRTIGNDAVRALFNKVLDADNKAGWNAWKKDGSEKAYVELCDAELALLTPPALRPAVA